MLANNRVSRRACRGRIPIQSGLRGAHQGMAVLSTGRVRRGLEPPGLAPQLRPERLCDDLRLTRLKRYRGDV